MGTHSVFAASALQRWGKEACPASARLEEKYPEQSSVFAQEGTCAHALAELMWDDYAEGYSVESLVKMYDGRKIELDDGTAWAVGEDMVRHVFGYLEYCDSLLTDDCFATMEQKVFPLKGSEHVFGTADFICYDEKANILHVVDLKYGQGIKVRARGNVQLLFYALGALRHLEKVHELSGAVATVAITIYQPRNEGAEGPVERWDADVLDLYDFEVYLEDSLELADSDDAPLCAGSWCRFCNHAPRCDALKGKALETARAQFDDGVLDKELPAPDTFSDVELGQILDTAHVLDIWLKEVRDYAHHRAEQGHCPKGWKLKDKQARRKWTDEEAAAKALLKKYPRIKRASIYVTKLKSPTQLEKTVHPAQYDAVADFVSCESSGTNLVHDGDPSERALPGATFEALTD